MTSYSVLWILPPFTESRAIRTSQISWQVHCLRTGCESQAFCLTQVLICRFSRVTLHCLTSILKSVHSPSPTMATPLRLMISVCDTLTSSYPSDRSIKTLAFSHAIGGLLREVTSQIRGLVSDSFATVLGNLQPGLAVWLADHDQIANDELQVIVSRWSLSLPL